MGAVDLGLLVAVLLWMVIFRFPGKVVRVVLIQVFRADIA